MSSSPAWRCHVTRGSRELGPWSERWRLPIACVLDIAEFELEMERWFHAVLLDAREVDAWIAEASLSDRLVPVPHALANPTEIAEAISAMLEFRPSRWWHTQPV